MRKSTESGWNVSGISVNEEKLKKGIEEDGADDGYEDKVQDVDLAEKITK